MESIDDISGTKCMKWGGKYFGATCSLKYKFRTESTQGMHQLAINQLLWVSQNYGCRNSCNPMHILIPNTERHRSWDAHLNNVATADQVYKAAWLRRSFATMHKPNISLRSIWPLLNLTSFASYSSTKSSRICWCTTKAARLDWQQCCSQAKLEGWTNATLWSVHFGWRRNHNFCKLLQKSVCWWWDSMIVQTPSTVLCPSKSGNIIFPSQVLVKNHLTRRPESTTGALLSGLVLLGPIDRLCCAVAQGLIFFQGDRNWSLMVYRCL